MELGAWDCVTGLEITAPNSYNQSMLNAPKPAADFDDEDAAELAALTLAVADSDADPGTAPHEKVRDWLLELASGNFEAPPPIIRAE